MHTTHLALAAGCRAHVGSILCALSLLSNSNILIIQASSNHYKRGSEQPAKQLQQSCEQPATQEVMNMASKTSNEQLNMEEI